MTFQRFSENISSLGCGWNVDGGNVSCLNSIVQPVKSEVQVFHTTLSVCFSLRCKSLCYMSCYLYSFTVVAITFIQVLPIYQCFLLTEVYRYIHSAFRNSATARLGAVFQDLRCQQDHNVCEWSNPDRSHILPHQEPQLVYSCLVGPFSV